MDDQERVHAKCESGQIPYSTGSAKDGGWRLDFNWLDKMRREIEKATGHDLTLECLEEAVIRTEALCLTPAAVEPAQVEQGNLATGERENMETDPTYFESAQAVEGEKDTIVQLIHKHVGIRQRINVDITGVEEAADAILAALTPAGGDGYLEEVNRQLREEVERLSDLIPRGNPNRSPAASDIVRLCASETSCYKWPEDTAEHRALRSAFMNGAASVASAALPAANESLRPRLAEVFTHLASVNLQEDAASRQATRMINALLHEFDVRLKHPSTVRASE